ncbi:MAG: bacterial transcriptional activator domain-containing protein, partial [Coriobacteriia bacterium]|nr:bacterial transcriptional activator domain-containing protein [Coriobacteriia bacterium]
LTEFLSNKQEREELREKSEELREKSEEGKEKTGGSGVERLALLTFIPWLDDEASRGLSDAIDEFLLQGYRVLVFCPAQNDRYQNLQSDRLEISALELKLAGYFTPLAYEDCLKRFLNEFLPLQIRLAAVLAAFLGRCTLKELSQLNYELHSDIPRLLEELHPLFTVVDSGCGIKADPVSLGHFEHDIAQVITEYLQTEGLQANTSVVASRITMLSITLLERGDLESSHQILEIAEALIKKEARGARSLGSPNKSSEPGLGAMSLDSNTAPSPYFAPLPQAGVLPLTVQLFGKLEICKEGVPLRNKYLTRSKVRRFVAFLVLNQPRMVSRESVVEYLWPYLDPLRAQRNLYTSWFMLARGLGAEGVRDCPYLLRNGEVYQLNPELISFDTVQFEALARSVLFGQLSRDAHEQSLLEIESLYRDSLAADIPPDEFIESKMAGFRSKMVDVLLFETRKRRASGELEKALFCVQSAFDLDETREDVFRELMDTQFEAGQRTLAMQTYFSCKQYLADELGILPSKRTTALYQDLLLDNSR